MILRLPLLLAGVLLLAGACSIGGGSDGGSDGGSAKPDYTPVADAELFSRLGEIPGVEAVDVSYNDTWPENGYVGEVTIASGQDPQQVLDTVYATLRQGRPGASITVGGIQDRRSISFSRLGGAGIPSTLEQRYGPQPGDGTPPQG